MKLLVLGGTKFLGRAAVEAGLTFRPLEETARDVPEWTGKAGLSAEREAELLAAWGKVRV